MTYSAIWPVLLDAIRLTMGVAGGIVVYDAARELLGLAPMHFPSRKESALKWAIGGLAAITFGLGLFVANHVDWLGRGTSGRQTILLVGSVFLSSMFIMRARTRVANRLAVDFALSLTFCAALIASVLDRGL